MAPGLETVTQYRKCACEGIHNHIVFFLLKYSRERAKQKLTKALLDKKRIFLYSKTKR